MAEEKSDGPNRSMVYLRIRPFRNGEKTEGIRHLFEGLEEGENKSCIVDTKPYTYDWIFDGPNVEQEDLYQKTTRPVVDNVFKGYWGTVMVYGQTGTGKSFTMCNFDPRQEGVVPRAMRQIFANIDEDRERIYTVCFSFIQIYCDKLQDLFNPEAAELKINRDKNGVSFPGITEHVVRDGDHFRELYEDGHQHRVITATKMNPESSRGHAALFVQIKSVPRDDPGGENRAGKLFLIDLAGYERFSKTGVQEGKMAQEAKTINASLLALGNVISGLAAGSDHIPWRDAKLTRMLEDAIGGKAKCSIILTAGPSNEHLHETVSTLYFGARAMTIKTNVVANITVDYKRLAQKLQEMLKDAQGKISNLEIEATRRQLEREQAEARFQLENATIKKRQEEQLQALLEGGADTEKIQAFIQANQVENDIMTEQQYTERAVMEARHEEEAMEALKEQQEEKDKEQANMTGAMSKDLREVQRQLEAERKESALWKEKAKEAEMEARRLNDKLKDTNLALERAAIDVPATGDRAELRRLFDEKVATIQAMLEENFALKLQEVEEPLRDELHRFQKLYEDLKTQSEEDLQSQKDMLTSMYEKEITEIRATSHEVQENLKKNHMTIKRLYQGKSEQMTAENEELSLIVATLTKQLQAAGIAPAQVKSSVSGDVKGEKSNQQLEQKLMDLRAEMEYIVAEREGLKKQLAALTESESDDRLSPAQIRQLKAANEELKNTKEKMEVELYKLRAAQALSVPEQVTSKMTMDHMDDHEDHHGDLEGIPAFVSKLSRTPFLIGAQPIINNHSTISQSLITDLDEMRRFVKHKLIFMGESKSGKTSFIRCLTGAVPIIRNLPEGVVPTIHPHAQLVGFEDPFVGKTDWHKMYVQFQDVEAPQQANFLGAIGGLLGARGGQEPARLHVDIVDMPGSRVFWRAVPPQILPGKGAIYCIVYDLTHPVDIARQSIEKQLTIIHACCTKNCPRNLGGDTPRIGFCLIGTHRDLMRDSRDSAVQQHLNQVTQSLGDVFFRLRGDDTFGLACIGNYAVSSKEWSVLGSKDRNPKNFKDLAVFLASAATQLTPNTPSAFLPTSKTGVPTMSYTIGDDLGEVRPEKVSLFDLREQRLRKGIVTLCTGLHREQKVRWFMKESEFRALICEHLAIQENDAADIATVNFIMREFVARSLIMALPSCILEPKYLPRTDGKVPPRDGIIILEPNRLLLMFSLFMLPSTIARHPPTADYLRDRQTIIVDVRALEKLPNVYHEGVLTEQLATTVYYRILGLTCNEPRLMYEFFSIWGLGMNIRSETAMLSPAHFKSQMSVMVTEYLSYLLGCFGDGIGRKYKLNAPCMSFFSRLQAKLMPFSHAPVNDPALNVFNYSDASFLVLEKSRLKWGTFGSKVLKDAVMSCGVPMKGILKIEGNHLYIAVTARGKNCDNSLALTRAVLDAIHYEISCLCAREFQGLNATFQEMKMRGAEEKRKKLPVGIQTILTRFQIPKEATASQMQIIGDLCSDPRGAEIENALRVLPKSALE